MQAYAEGFELMQHSEFDLDLERDRRHLALRLGRPLVAARAAARGVRAARRRASTTSRRYVEDSGEGRWTINEAIDENVPVPVIARALFARFASRRRDRLRGEGRRPRCATSSAATRCKAVEGGEGRPVTAVSSLRTRCSRAASCGRTPGPVRARDLRRVRRPDAAQALPRALRARVPRACCRSASAIVGVARTEQTTKQFVAAMEEAVSEHARDEFARRRLGRARRRRCATSRPTSPTTAARTGVVDDAARARRGARHGGQPPLLPRRPAGGVRDDRPRARRAAQRRGLDAADRREAVRPRPRRPRAS